MNEVSIIINGVRYDAVEVDDYNFSCHTHCDLNDMCRAHCNYNLCEQLGVNLYHCFKKSYKKFEK